MCKGAQNEYDWMIHAITNNDSDRRDPECMIDFRTVGFSKYGFGEIVVVGKVKDAERVADMINTFGGMFKSGEEFSSSFVHCIDDEDGNTKYKFEVFYGEYEDGEKWIQLIPDWYTQQDYNLDKLELEMQPENGLLS